MFKKNILYKSINLEVFKNFLGCLTILFILVASSRLLGYFDKSIAGNLESDLILSILILRSPEFINLLIPLSFFLSVLIALGRLYMDHEIYAYQSAGYSKMAFVKSLLFQTFSLTTISVFLSFYVTPDFEKRADGISVPTFIVIAFALILWLIYGVLVDSIALIISNIMTLIVIITVLIGAFKVQKENKYKNPLS